jgi:membrane protease YdiL (CAAX protease family)
LLAVNIRLLDENMTNGNDSMNEQVQQPVSIGARARRSRLSAVVSWFFIIATILFSQMPQYKAVKATSSDSVQDLPLELTGKYIVGLKHLLGQQAAIKRSFEQMTRALQKNQSVRKQLLIVPILAEISGKDAALIELERLTSNTSDVAVARDASLFLQLYRNGVASLGPQQRLSIQHYGWIGELALSQDKPASDPARSAILQSAFRTVVFLVIFMIGILIALAAGLVLLVIAIIFRAKGRLYSRLTMPENPEISLLEAFTIYLTGFMGLPALTIWLFPGFRLGAALMAIPAVIIAILWPRFRGSNWKNYRTALGWRRGQGFFYEIGAGILGYIAGLPLLLCAAAFSAMISRFTGNMPVHPLLYELGRSPLYLLIGALLACVWAPVVEETFFRGVLFGYFRHRVHWVVSGILTALLFAVVHPQGWIGVPLIAAIGFTLSAIREWRGSLIASMSAHALNNASALIFFIALN